WTAGRASPKSLPISSLTSPLDRIASSRSELRQQIPTRFATGPANAEPESVAAPDFETKLRSFLEHGPGKEAPFDFGWVAFDLGAATLTATAHEELQRLAGILREHPGTHAVIGVHNDAGGGANQIARLSAQRAKTVRRELMRLGIGHSFVTVAGEGRDSLRASTTARPGCIWIYVRKK
ncbi:MAG: hypothetical protein FJX40_15095, partial [Alphaproteobacteria bacterium]|nr:hypothetical protein [Alphaproteobacteria bacterium]